MDLNKWTPVLEFLPVDDRMVLGWSEIFRMYYICTFNPVFGWRDVDKGPLKSITHWLDEEIAFPWPPINKVDRDAYKKYAKILEDEDENE